jgi:TolA-binding protein
MANKMLYYFFRGHFCRVFLLILLVQTSGIPPLKGQRTQFYEDPAYTFRLAQELFEKEKYSAARDLFEGIIAAIPDRQSLLRADAEFYAAVAAAELRHPDAQERLSGFVDDYPGHVRIPTAYFHLGRILYERRSYRRAAEAFTHVRLEELTTHQQDEFHFIAGYSWFEAGDYVRAKQSFHLLKDKNTRFKAYATYYYAHVCYLQEDYDEALKYFQMIQDHPDFRPLIAYYFAQILYNQQRYDEMAGMITPLIDQGTTRRLGTISRLIGDAFYKLNLYDEALGYMEIYLKEASGNITRVDAYQIGYVYYRAGDYRAAIDMFQRVTGPSDSLAQNAYYHLADTYIRNNEKRFAMNAFLEAYKLGIDAEVTEDALYNYAKLSYELDFNPHNQAIRAFEQFLGDYPNSPRAASAQALLVNLYLSTRNYRSALSSIEKIKTQNDEMRAAYQKIAYYRGVELFNDNQFNEALEVFERSLSFDPDKRIRALTWYWMGEAHYRLGEWEKAREYYNRFQVSPTAFDMPEFNLANYNIGYTLFKQKQYDPALIAFRKFLLNPDPRRTDIIQDATLRAGDSYFMKRDFNNAVTFYRRAAEAGGRGTDYATYQQAQALGAMGRFQAKAELLEDFVKKHPRSEYRDDALFELGNTWLNIDQPAKSLHAFERLLAEHQGSIFEREALLKTGMIHNQTGRTQLAFRYFDRLVNEYRGSEESGSALLYIRDIFVIADSLEGYYSYVRDKTQRTVADSERDSLTYRVAENHYLDSDCERALPAFRNYIRQFPDGLFIINAQFYQSECLFVDRKFSEALPGYLFVTTRHRTMFTELALLRAAEIHLMNDDCTGALEKFIRLEQNADNRLYLMQSRTGQMRCHDRLGDHLKAHQTASRIVREKQHTEEIITEAYLILGRSALALDSMSGARKWFGEVAQRTRNEMAAEAKYSIALIQFKMMNYDMAEKEVFDLINNIPSYDYWIAKAFILLADVYVQTDNTFQAKHTLQSIIDNYDGDDELKDVARQKLREIAEMERLMEERRAEEEIEIRIRSVETPDQGF